MSTDTQLKQSVLDELKREKSINSATTGVTTKDGVVTLMGHVDTYAQTGVSNQITIKPRVDAGVIKDEIMIALNRSWLCPEKTDVTARDGKVTLTGTVDYWDVRAFAGTTAWAAPGVTSVTHDIRVY